MHVNWTRIFNGPEPVRINKWLAQEGVCSRREAEALIAAGHVRVNGEPVKDLGHKISTGQTITLAKAAGAALEAQVTLVVHKPVGLVSAQPEPGQIPAARLLTRERQWGPVRIAPDPAWRVAPLGRLDMDSRGLLLLSQDGVLTKAIIGPLSKLEKEYHVTLAGQLAPQKIKLLRHGLSLDGRALKPAKVEEIGQGRLRFVLTEGRNRQIRRMAEAVGLQVTDLIRVRIGPLQLGELPEGRWRPLTDSERATLIAQSK